MEHGSWIKPSRAKACDHAHIALNCQANRWRECRRCRRRRRVCRMCRCCRSTPPPQRRRAPLQRWCPTFHEAADWSLVQIEIPFGACNEVLGQQLDTTGAAENFEPHIGLEAAAESSNRQSSAGCMEGFGVSHVRKDGQACRWSCWTEAYREAFKLAGRRKQPRTKCRKMGGEICRQASAPVACGIVITRCLVITSMCRADVSAGVARGLLLPGAVGVCLLVQMSGPAFDCGSRVSSITKYHPCIKDGISNTALEQLHQT